MSFSGIENARERERENGRWKLPSDQTRIILYIFCRSHKYISQFLHVAYTLHLYATQVVTSYNSFYFLRAQTCACTLFFFKQKINNIRLRNIWKYDLQPRESAVFFNRRASCYRVLSNMHILCNSSIEGYRHKDMLQLLYI